MHGVLTSLRLSSGGYVPCDLLASCNCLVSLTQNPLHRWQRAPDPCVRAFPWFEMWRAALESMNAEILFTEVLSQSQIYHVVSGKALVVGDDPAALHKGQTINVGSKDDVSEIKKVGCCSV
ncbi:ras-related RABA1f-like [Olea europaea subsp. europaea]|uniref:Ras-related RABA1f-like n=1 Tax=Olea europaea subsp. europaea TaxID=158383 RepID=A0A8S0QX53_OLEEU|nr:ras-related RABA1f-like [Olea europaea subsp. europaea]